MSDINKFFNSFQKRIFHARHIFLFPGESAEYIYYINSGRVKKYLIDSRGNETILHMYGNTDVFPLDYAVNRTIENYHIEAKTEVYARYAPIKEFELFLDSSHSAIKTLLSKELLRQNQTSKKVLHLMNSNAKQRLIYELLIEARRAGKPSKTTFSILLNETELGARAGLSRETVGRIIQELKLEKIVAMKSKIIHVTDLLKLEQKLSGLT